MAVANICTFDLDGSVSSIVRDIRALPAKVVLHCAAWGPVHLQSRGFEAQSRVASHLEARHTVSSKPACCLADFVTLHLS